MQRRAPTDAKLLLFRLLVTRGGLQKESSDVICSGTLINRGTKHVTLSGGFGAPAFVRTWQHHALNAQKAARLCPQAWIRELHGPWLVSFTKAAPFRLRATKSHHMPCPEQLLVGWTWSIQGNG